MRSFDTTFRLPSARRLSKQFVHGQWYQFTAPNSEYLPKSVTASPCLMPLFIAYAHAPFNPAVSTSNTAARYRHPAAEHYAAAHRYATARPSHPAAGHHAPAATSSTAALRPAYAADLPPQPGPSPAVAVPGHRRPQRRRARRRCPGH